MITILPVQSTTAPWVKYSMLFKECFSISTKFSETALQWLYHMNPEGPVVGFDAWDGEDLVAHYACIPTAAIIDGRSTKALLSLNTATHPRYQGQGLFSKLAAHTYDAAAAMGFDAVYGIANANSTPGFTRKLGFQLVRPLEAKIGFGPIRIDVEKIKSTAQFRRIWTQESLHWRCSNPNNPVRAGLYGDAVYFNANAVGPFVQAYAERPFEGEKYEKIKPMLPSVRVYLGAEPRGCQHFKTYVDIPTRFKPSPLNFIYRSLSSRVIMLDHERISFSFLDFDAY